MKKILAVIIPLCLAGIAHAQSIGGSIYPGLNPAPTSTLTLPTETISNASTSATCASPIVFTWTANALQNGESVVLSGTAPCPTTGPSLAVPYYVVAVTANTFEIALTPGGAAIAGTGTASNAATVTKSVPPSGLLASSATAGSITVPSITLTTAPYRIQIPIVKFRTNVTTGWGAPATGVGAFYVTFWSAAPTYTYGNYGAYTVATGAANRLGLFVCTIAQYGDGASGECSPLVGTSMEITTNAALFWDVENVGAFLTPISGQTFTITLEPYPS
jgi:hypothetical protein